MKKPVRLIVVLSVVMALAAAWVWRFVTLNKYYDDLNNSDYKLYKAGELVPFEDDGYDLRTDLNGYHLRVDGYEVKDYDAYLSETGISLPNKQDAPEKLALVYITLVNESCEPNPVNMTSFTLRGVDTVVNMDLDVLVKANPILEGTTGIALRKGTECKLVLPYKLSREGFKRTTWWRIDKYKMYLQVTGSLTQKEVCING